MAIRLSGTPETLERGPAHSIPQRGVPPGEADRRPALPRGNLRRYHGVRARCKSPKPSWGQALLRTSTTWRRRRLTGLGLFAGLAVSLLPVPVGAGEDFVAGSG